MASEKPLPPKAAPPPPSPNLDKCIKSMISLGRNAAALSTTNQAALISAMMGFSIHLSRDQDTLSTYLIGSSKECPGGLPFSEMPAIREVVTNSGLLQCLLSMLSNMGTFGPPLPHGSSYQQKQGRKRSPSEDVAPSRKKPLLSPTPMNRSHPKQSQLRVVSAEGSKGQLSEKNIPVFAATILYSVFQHADYWPVHIMRAFAEDSFGARNWVDDERCKAFVSNLVVSLKPEEAEDNLGRKSASAAEDAEAYFSSLFARASLIKSTMGPGNTVTNGTMAPSSQPPKTLSSKEKRKQTKMTNSINETSSSSSSGEEELLESETVSSSLSLPHHSPSKTSPLHILFQPSSISKKRVRRRYLVRSLVLAYEAISDAFQSRLDSKSKQNYRLLQTLPTFLSIPRVRCLASRHLERWLQSPALAGLARNIFACTVQELSCVDPPLPGDLELIDNILKLNLKSNQLSMHIEHVTMVAKKIPTQNVAHLIFRHCLQGECSNGSVSNALKPNDDHLRMLRSVYAVLDRKLAAYALASSVLTSYMPNPISKKSDLNSHLQNISCLLSAVVDALGKLYDGFHFVQAIIKAQSGSSKTISSVNTAARLIFECTLLVTRMPSLQNAFEASASRNATKKSASYDFDVMDEGELNRFRKNMLGIRKVILRWCATDLYCAYYAEITNEEHAKCSDTYYEQGAVTKGPGAPDYDSVLGVNSFPEENGRSSSFQRMMSLIRCILFLSPKEMETFSMAEEETKNDRLQRIEFCSQYGIDIDNEMLQIILSSPNITPNTALSVIENLLSRCGNNCLVRISCHVDTVWDMYKLAEYTPVFHSDLDNNSGKDHDSSTPADKDGVMEKSDGKRIERKGSQAPKLPRLAVTSMWWRVSSVALVLSGLLPDQIGSRMWDENPTLSALIRMTTSQKYRFPTADCSETKKEKVRQAEETTKEQEAKIAELLFMPLQQQKVAKPKPQIIPLANGRQGLRSSARQKAKHERNMAIEQERQAAALHAENMKLRKVLRTLQKNVMLGDPKQEQRKPPKGSIDLLLSVNDSFALAEKFRLSTSPDFLLQTIGEGRSAIERAYDWLIPIISSHPAIIDRLQPSASCFLLLRAYGVEGGKNRELLVLTSPLLLHVTKCLTGEFGEHHALLAMDLLLQDIADENDDRRRCARKVLQEAVGDPKLDPQFKFQRDLGSCGWLSQMTQVKNSKELVPMVIKYLTHALAYERGKVLSIYISALSEYKQFSKMHNLTMNFDFVATLCELIAVRSHVCSDAFDRFPSLRALAIAHVKNAFGQAIESNCNANLRASTSSLITISIPREVSDSVQKRDISNVVVSSNLLHAAVILISNWQRMDDGDCEAQNDEETSILHLLRYLIIPFMPNSLDKGDGNTVSGLSSAKHKHNEKRAVSVEEWVLLAKARAEEVAKHAALSAPHIFLPRLLLCCGMPSPSFYTMLRRLDKMGESSTNSGKTYEEMVSPTAVSEWGLPGIGSRRIIKRKLYGRILAYMRIHGKQTRDRVRHESLFISWLSAENNCSGNSRKTQLKSQISTGFANNVKSCMLDSDDSDDFMDEEEGAENSGDIWPSDELKHVTNTTTGESLAEKEILSRDFVNSCVALNKCNVLEESLDLIMANRLHGKEFKGTAAAKALLASYESFHDNPSFVRIMLKWVPLLTRDRGEDQIWHLIFIEETKHIHGGHLKSLVCECALTWSDEHIAECKGWIVSQQTKNSPWKSVCTLELVLRFLVVSSEQKSIHCFDYDDVHLNFPYAQPKQCAIALTKLALSYACLEVSNTISNDSEKGVSGASDRRNALPDWLTLVLLVGKSHQTMVTRLILEEIDEAKVVLVLSSVLLRLYVMSPLKMDLSDSKLRNVLLQASNDHLPSWLFWRSPLDSQLSELLSNLTKSPHQRLTQSITDISKQHPLIFVRHLNTISQMLLEDGSGRDSDQQRLIKRGRIYGRYPSGDAVAKVGDHIVKVIIVLWGYSFNEPVWNSVIEVLMALPLEVVFTCGVKIGLTEILETYLKLFVVQIVELNSESNIIRVRDNFMNLINTFRKYNSKAFGDWMQQDVPDWGSVQILLSVSGIGA